jgi:hypothetical protein
MQPNGLSSYSSFLSCDSPCRTGAARDPLALARERLARVRATSAPRIGADYAPAPQDERDERNEETLELDESWNATAACMLIAAVYQRVSWAWNATPPARRPEDAYRALVPHERAMWMAYTAQDLAAVRQAVMEYEAQAAPIFERWRER